MGKIINHNAEGQMGPMDDKILLDDIEQAVVVSHTV
jgi:hypothetical protein